MTLFEAPVAPCRHDRAVLKRLGKITHERTGKRVYVLLCTECGFTVTTDELRRLRGGGPPRSWPRTGRDAGRAGMVAGRPAPHWA